MSIKFGGFVDYLCSLLTNHSQTWQFYYFLGSLFSGIDWFSLTGPCQKMQCGEARRGLFSECDAMYRDCGCRKVNIFPYSKNPDHG